jgi:D-amino-acid dehydrogenase
LRFDRPSPPRSSGFIRQGSDTMAVPDRDVTVIGAGIVGVCCALYLQREGFQVRLIDRGGPGEGASFGNAGNLGFASCVPMAMPGVLKKVPRMLFDADAPLKLRMSHLPRALPWLLRFIAASRPSAVEGIADARHSLLSRLHEGYDPLIADAGAQDLINPSGLIMTWESEEAFAGAAYALDLRRRRGIHFETLDGNEARQIEPSLSPAVTRAVYIPRLAHVLDPLRLTQALARNFERRGGAVVRAAASGFEIGPDGPRKVMVIAAASTPRRDFGRRSRGRWPNNDVRWRPARYRHVPRQETAARGVSADRYIAVTHMKGIRAAGIANHRARRAAGGDQRAPCAAAQALVPSPASRSEWIPRQSYPIKPVIGRSPRYANVYFAFGHDHIGLSLAGITGKLIGELVAGRPTSVDLAPFRPDRFDPRGGVAGPGKGGVDEMSLDFSVVYSAGCSSRAPAYLLRLGTVLGG